jgi:hypothetical protein
MDEALPRDRENLAKFPDRPSKKIALAKTG